jgi:hypothetical protein
VCALPLTQTTRRKTTRKCLHFTVKPKHFLTLPSRLLTSPLFSSRNELTLLLLGLARRPRQMDLPARYRKSMHSLNSNV